MIRVRLQINNGQIYDTIDEFGLVYLSSDHRFEAPLREMEKTTYAEEEGEHLLNKIVRDAFDYNVEFFIKANGALKNANDVIASFNSRLYTQDDDSDLMQFHQVTFYNDYKKVKIVGIPSLISEASEFWRDSKGTQHDVVKVEWRIRVSKPNLCDFNYD